MTRTIHRGIRQPAYRRRYLPGEFLNAVRELKLKGQGSTDYGLHRTLKLRDEISRYWRIAKAEWRFSTKPVNGKTLTEPRWL